MINQEDYQIIQPGIEKKYVSEKELSIVLNSLEPNDKQEKSIKDLPGNDPRQINEKRNAIISALSYFDPDNLGIINAFEMKDILEGLNIQCDSHIKYLIDKAEIEGNGYINYRDFAYNIIK